MDELEVAPVDEVKGLVQMLAEDYAAASSWTEFVENSRGKEGDFHPHVKRLLHAAVELLEDLRVTGARVKLSTPKLSMAQKKAALDRGPHQSARAHTAFQRGELAAMIRKKQWILLPAVLMIT
jgi:hypothetical protein